MKGVIALLVLSNLFTATSASAMDARQAFRDHLTFCNQFIIHAAIPAI
jgi:hypothetical protein